MITKPSNLSCEAGQAAVGNGEWELARRAVRELLITSRLYRKFIILVIAVSERKRGHSPGVFYLPSHNM
jgi:hypothetical protein